MPLKTRQRESKPEAGSAEFVLDLEQEIQVFKFSNILGQYSPRFWKSIFVSKANL